MVEEVALQRATNRLVRPRAPNSVQKIAAVISSYRAKASVASSTEKASDPELTLTVATAMDKKREDWKGENESHVYSRSFRGVGGRAASSCSGAVGPRPYPPYPAVPSLNLLGGH
jgi:hypothetical protein